MIKTNTPAMIRKTIPPVVVILGSTGTGKTKLSLEIAKLYRGEVISADSMQVYSGLDVATAKATREEQQQAKHHLLDVAQPGQLYSVRQFQNSALPIIDDLLQRDKVPVIVGGTNYYIEGLLWKILIDEWQASGQPAEKKPKMTEQRVFDQCDMNHLSSEELHAKLKEVDPETAAQLHPNNKRKIIRALEVYERSGRLFSAFIKDQQAEGGGSALGGPLRYDNLIIFWLCCDQDVLNERLDKRVDGMVQQGLLTEIRSFHEQFVKPYGAELDYTKGILQTIGFKEFEPYLNKFNRTDDKTLDDYFKGISVEAPASLSALIECLDELKLATRRYSKKQIKWVRNRFLKAPEKNRAVPPIYKLDTTNPSRWAELVSDPARNVIDHYLDKTVELKIRPEVTEEEDDPQVDSKKTFVCESCHRVFIGEFQWAIHLKSNKHKKVRERLRKQERNQDKSADKSDNT